MKRKNFVSRHRMERKHTLAKSGGNHKILTCPEKDILQKEHSKTAGIEAEYLWGQILEIMEENVSGVSFETWIQPCKVRAFSDNKLMIEAENVFFKEMLEKRFVSLMNTALKKLLTDEAEVVVVVEQY